MQAEWADKKEGILKISDTDLHGIGSLLADYVFDEKSVKSAAYRQKHPTYNYILLKVQAKDPSTPINSAITSIKKELSQLSKDFSKAWKQ